MTGPQDPERAHPMTMIVTGGAGFIGSHYVRHRVRTSGDAVVNVDALSPSYCAASRRHGCARFYCETVKSGSGVIA